MKLNELTNQPDALLLIEIDDITKEVQATSLRLAEVLGIRHDNVLRAIRNQKERAEDVLDGVLEDTDIPKEYLPFLRKVNPIFTADEYRNEQNREYYPFYKLNRDACVITIAQLQGKKAMAWILAYIGAFNMMEEDFRRKKEVPIQRMEAVTDHILNKRFDKLEREVKTLIQNEIKRLR